MDLAETIEELRREVEKLERVIASLEEVQATVTVPIPEQKRCGRKFMTPEERREVSARMKKYWANRLGKRYL
jgi:hypothetical protein